MVWLMEDVFIVDAARSPIGKFLGRLSGIGATHLAAEVLRGMLRRTQIDKNGVDDLILGNVISSGLGQNIAKQVVVYAGLPNRTPAYAVNKVCASSLKAVALGSEEISAGNADIVIAGGTESMSNAPFVLNGVRKFHKFGDVELGEFLSKVRATGSDPEKMRLVDEMLYEGLIDCYSGKHMGSIAESMASEYGITRSEEDEFALESHRKAAAAEDSGKFSREIIPVTAPDGNVVSGDEGIRRDTSLEKLSALKPAFESGGTITAGNSSQLSDGASFLILVSRSKMEELGLKPLAQVISYSASGSDPDKYGIAPVASARNALEKAGLGTGDVDLVELNEAFCVQALSVIKSIGIEGSKFNVNGGATALGHPLGATGACILSTLLYALHDRNKQVGLATLCHGGGGAMSVVVRRG